MKQLLYTMTILLGSVLSAASPVNITVEAGEVTGAVNSLGFGHNLEAADGRGFFGETSGAPTFRLNGVKFGQGLWDPAANAPNPVTTAEAAKLNIGMMRYPGGCLAHNFNWKQAVGPLSERPDWKFGVDQFLELCKKMNWEPVITLTDYALPAAELPKHLAEFVEYLNAPAVPEHPWAMKRALWGHPEPYGVKYFEIGNESHHGNHECRPKRVYDPAEYVRYALDTIREIRKVDPTVKLGLNTVPGNGLDFNCQWNRDVIAGAGAETDFLVVHYYGPGIAGVAAPAALRAVLAYPDQLIDRMADYRRLTRELIGRELPLAVTEYNVRGSGNKPYPSRLTFLAGLMNAELQRLWQQPENNVLFANYWQIVNGWWGAFYSDDATGKITRRAATLPFFEAWGRFRADNIVKVTMTDCPRVEAAPASGLFASSGDRHIPAQHFEPQKTFTFDFPAKASSLVETSVGNNGFDVQFREAQGNCYDIFTQLKRPAGLTANSGMKITVRFDARFLPAPGSETSEADFGLGLCDTRGYAATMSAIAITGVQRATAGWRPFSGELESLYDAESVDLLFRIENPGKPISGKVEIRNLEVAISGGAVYPAYPALGTFATVAKDGKRLCLIVINKSPDRTIDAKLNLTGFQAASGHVLELYQEKVESTEYFDAAEAPVKLEHNSFSYRFLPHSLTAFEFQTGN